MSIRTAYYLMQRSGVNYKVSGLDLINRDTSILNAGDVFLVERSGTAYKFTVSLDAGGDVDTSSIQDDDLFVCFIDGSEKKINGLEFSALVSPNVWETKDSWTHIITDIEYEWQSVYGYDHDGVYRLDGTLIAAAASSTELTTESEFVITGNSSTVSAGGIDVRVAWLSNIGTRTDLSRAFQDLPDLTLFDGYWDMTNVTNMAQMFYNVGPFTADVSSWNTSNVTNMSDMFYRSGWGDYTFNVTGLSSWDTTNVTCMSFMFEGIDLTEDITGWDVSNVTNMSYMFAFGIFNQNIGGWDVANVTNMARMFNESSTFNQNIGGWDVANVTNMDEMFYYYSAGQFNQNLSGWCVTNIGSKPNDFDTNSAFAGQTALQPQWGTCP